MKHDMIFEGRVLWARVHRPTCRPWLVANMYGHANEPIMRNQMIKKCAQFARASNEDFIILGDFNCVEDEGGMAEVLANGVAFSADAQFGQDRLPTRDSGKRFDYAVTSSQFFLTERLQQKGCADHDNVTYYLQTQDDQLRPLIGPAFIKLQRTTPIAADELFLHCNKQLFES